MGGHPSPASSWRSQGLEKHGHSSAKQKSVWLRVWRQGSSHFNSSRFETGNYTSSSSCSLAWCRFPRKVQFKFASDIRAGQFLSDFELAKERRPHVAVSVDLNFGTALRNRPASTCHRNRNAPRYIFWKNPGGSGCAWYSWECAEGS